MNSIDTNETKKMCLIEKIKKTLKEKSETNETKT